MRYFNFAIKKLEVNRKKVLQDHKKVATNFQTPLNQLNIQEITYVNRIVPEVIWILILNNKFGFKVGVDIGYAFFEVCSNLVQIDESPFYLSWFSNLNKTTCDNIKQELTKIGIYKDLSFALSDFCNVFPASPINKIFESKSYTESNIKYIKEVLIILYNKQEKDTVIALTNILYFLNRIGELKIVEGSPFDQINEVLNYPETLTSRTIANSVCATISLLFGEISEKSIRVWNSYFWNRCLEIEPVTI